MPQLDISFDFRTDSFGGDPDSASKTLKSFHKMLWSKQLPNGDFFELEDDVRGSYLNYRSLTCELPLSSDSITHSYKNLSKMKSILQGIDPMTVENFQKLTNTIGGFILFPSRRIDGKMNINGARGFNPKIMDRFDLTLECIRRHYLAEVSPLEEVLERYSGFFELFQSFRGYVDFFLLNDLVSFDYSQVIFFTPISELFSHSPLPQSQAEYLQYRQSSMDFVSKRNTRALDWIMRNDRL